MIIRFLRDYQGRFTAERFYPAGTVVDIPEGALIVAEGAAEPVRLEVRAGQVEPEPPRRGRPRKKADDAA